MTGELPLALALTAGLVAAFNPCGFALLPAYLTMLVADDRPDGGGVLTRGPVRRAVLLGTAMTAGFVTVFGLFGLVVTPLAASAGRYLPWVTIVIGVALCGLGVWLLAGRELLVRVPTPATGRPVASFGSLYGYGLSYAVASLSCTIGPFLAVTSASLAAGGLVGGLLVFVAYGAGMGLVVVVLSLAVALARSAVAARARALSRHVSRISGALLVPAGLYVAYYGWYELRVFTGAPPGDLVVDAVTAVQGAVVRWLEAVGPGRIVLALALLVAAALAVRLLRRGGARTGPDARPDR
ncbi:cytochrome c biogenesis CcdA family protein [Nonomuraea candida]|uniref:cytochrome c biogenesis CcdA family protein n=1 Tax=Nonomuraea candida TaxID=359159 RepID=UPI0005B85487|nr:cytochrome c biogenesis protein CcdA [Nonomuraea candida]